MRGENKERWKVLCEQAAVEQDPEKLLELTRQINDLLSGKRRRFGWRDAARKTLKFKLMTHYPATIG